MKTIFTSILSYYFRSGGFSNEIMGMNEKLVSATLLVYKRIQEDLKPTPLKSHYTFNLRDVSKVICGICMIEKGALTNSDVAIRLWAHETVRVFGDRLINDKDRTWIMTAIIQCLRCHHSRAHGALRIQGSFKRLIEVYLPSYLLAGISSNRNRG